MVIIKTICLTNDKKYYIIKARKSQVDIPKIFIIQFKEFLL